MSSELESAVSSPEIFIPRPAPARMVGDSDLEYLRARSPLSDVRASTISPSQSYPPAVVLASAGYDHTIRFWDVIQGQCIGTFQHNESHVNCLALSPDKLFLAAGGHPAIRLYETMMALRAGLEMSRMSLEGMGTSAQPPIDPTATASTTTITAALSNHHRPLMVLEGHQKNVIALGFLALGKQLWSVGEEGQIRVWNFTEHIDGNQISDNGKPPTGISYTGQVIRQWESGCAPTCASPHPNQQALVIGDEQGRIRLIRLLPDGQVVGETKLEYEKAIRDVAISPDAQMIAAVDHLGGLWCWAIVPSSSSSSGSPLSLESDISLSGLTDASNNSATISSSTDASPTLKPHKIATGTAKSPANIRSSSSQSSNKQSIGLPAVQLVLQGAAAQAHSRHALRCMFSPDSTHLLTTSADGSAKLWQLSPDTGFLECIQHFVGHTRWVWDCAFSADSAYVLTASSDETIRLWDVRSAETVAIYAGHSKAVTCVALNDFPTL